MYLVIGILMLVGAVTAIGLLLAKKDEAQHETPDEHEADREVRR